MPTGPGTPYDVQAPDGTRYVSFADWLCPGPLHRARDLSGDPGAADLGDGRRDGATSTRRLGQTHPTAGPVLFTCRHRVYGVGMFDVATVLEGDAVVARAGARPGAP